MANVPISNFTVPANTVGIGATGYSLTGSASASFIDLTGQWNTSGTPSAIKLNITNTASNAASKYLDIQVSSSPHFSIKRGSINGTSAILEAQDWLVLSSVTGGLSFQPGGSELIRIVGNGFTLNGQFGLSAAVNAPDVLLTRRAAANLRLGAADAAAPVAQTLSVQSVVAGTSNTAGANLTITGSQGTGTGAGGSIVFQVAPAGSSGTAQNALATALTITGDRRLVLSNPGSSIDPSIVAYESAGAQSGFFFPNSGVDLAWTRADSAVWGVGFLRCSVGSGARFSWSSGVDPLGTEDLILARDAANTLALRNGANAQFFNIYKSYTDASNYERLAIGYSAGAGAFVIQRENAGTGSAQNLLINGGSQVLGIGLAATGAVTWTINSSGHFLAGADNTYDIGASGANRPRRMFAAGYITAPEVLTGNIKTAGGGGGLEFNSTTLATLTQTTFAIGGTTSSFPALKRSTTILQARLADDSAFATIQGKLRADVNAVAETPTATHTITITDAAGTAYKVLCVAA